MKRNKYGSWANLRCTLTAWKLHACTKNKNLRRRRYFGGTFPLRDCRKKSIRLLTLPKKDSRIIKVSNLRNWTDTLTIQADSTPPTIEWAPWEAVCWRRENCTPIFGHKDAPCKTLKGRCHTESVKYFRVQHSPHKALANCYTTDEFRFRS